MNRTATSVRYTVFVTIALVFIPIVTMLFLAHIVFATNYSSGTYGTCTYDDCSITLASTGTVPINVTPTGLSTRCTVSNDVVTATTGSSTGYTVSMTDSDTSNTLDGPASIPTNSSVSTSPTTLSTNTWGYRVDTVDGFGAGPTSVVTNGTTPPLTFAGIPISTGTPALIHTTNAIDSSPVNTSVWYGICVNSSTQSGAYSDGVTYTATIN